MAFVRRGLGGVGYTDSRHDAPSGLHALETAECDGENARRLCGMHPRQQLLRQGDSRHAWARYAILGSIGRNMNFFPHAAFEVPRKPSGLIDTDSDSLNSFWGSMDAELQDNVSQGIGCYVFSLRAGKGVLPWYVGKAERQSFRSECFAAHKINHYNTIVTEHNGTPLLTLIAKYTPGGKIVLPTKRPHNDIEYLETLLIAAGIRRNCNLVNIQGTRLLTEMVVPGVLNTPRGKASKSVVAFRDLMGT